MYTFFMYRCTPPYVFYILYIYKSPLPPLLPSLGVYRLVIPFLLPHQNMCLRCVRTPHVMADIQITGAHFVLQYTCIVMCT